MPFVTTWSTNTFDFFNAALLLHYTLLIINLQTDSWAAKKNLFKNNSINIIILLLSMSLNKFKNTYEYVLLCVILLFCWLIIFLKASESKSTYLWSWLITSAAAYWQYLMPWHLRTSFFTEVPRNGQSLIIILPQFHLFLSNVNEIIIINI